MISSQQIRDNVHHHPVMTELDIHLFKEGRHFHLYEKLGSHLAEINGEQGCLFALWAPNAESVSVIGDFNGWNRYSHPLYRRWDSSGIFEGFIPGITRGCKYKYYIQSKIHGQTLEKGDPFAVHWETPSRTASIVWDLNFTWNDEHWQKIKGTKNSHESPISVYEMHHASWQKNDHGSRLSYRELAEKLPRYLNEMGFTHVEFLPLMEHPFYGSWGYQNTGFFAPSARYGTPQDLMHLINTLHHHGIGVYLDWVPGHFPNDEHGLSRFDGTALFEHEDTRKGLHPDWNTKIFNYGRNEVRSFLISSAIFWLDKYRVDGLRVDAVASMLYLDYSRKHDEWLPNIYGGRENLEAVSFIKELNEYTYKLFPDIQMIAEESTAWPIVTRPTSVGGLGFGLKWDMGWMHDTLRYMTRDPIYRKYHHHELLFNLCYFYSENFILSISHDEVAHGKHSLLQKMPGDYWQKFANLRLFYGYLFTHPGKKLLFMGAEIATWDEWNHESFLEWHLLDYWSHQGVKRLIQDLNRIYVNEKALYECDFSTEGFTWCVMDDSDNSVLAYLRSGKDAKEKILVICNFTPVPRSNYVVGIPVNGTWEEIINTDLGIYGGSDYWKNNPLTTRMEWSHGHPYKLIINIPPLSTIAFKLKK